MKKLSLSNCRVKYRDPAERMSDKAFMVADDLGNHSKFSAKTASIAQGWVDKIRLVISQEEERRRQEVGFIRENVCLVVNRYFLFVQVEKSLIKL